MYAKSKLKINIIYNISLQIITLFLPFILTPYISRVLLPEGIGIYSYANSITSYFTLIAGFGMATYGTRQVAYVKSNKDELSKTFFSILFLKFIILIFALIIYEWIIFSFFSEYNLYLQILIMLIISSFFDISWLYFGLEEFKKTVIRSLIIKILTIFFTFIFVKSKNDLLIYFIITSFGNLIGNLILWININKRIRFVRITLNDIITHVKPASVIFISFIAIEVYTVLDKTMIGFLASAYDVGVYTYSEQFAKASLGIIGAISTVLLPHMSSLIKNNNLYNYQIKFNEALKIVSMISIGASFGLIGISNIFVPLMLGEQYTESIYLLIILSPLTFIISTSNIISRANLLPKKQEKICNIAVIIGAVSNFLLNLILIPKYQAYGACIGTIVAELLVTAIHIIAARKDIFKQNYINALVKYIIAGMSMLVIIIISKDLFSISWYTLFIQIIFGGFTYFLMLLFLKEKNIVNIKNIIFNKLKLIIKK